MKQKYLLIGAAAILVILVVLTSLIGNLSNKTRIPTTIQEPTPTNSNTRINNQLPAPTLSTGQKNYVAFQNLLNVLSPGSTGQNNVATPPSTAKTPTTPPLTEEQIVKRNEAKAQQNYEAFNNLLGIVFGQGSPNQGSQQQSSFYPSTPSLSLKSPPSNFQLQNQASSVYPPTSNLVYYPQCKGPYDKILLPGGCNLCAAGCGPTSVAMILSSYIDKKFTPPTVVNLYKENGLTAGCQGTTIVDGQTILSQNGLKTTDILYYGDSSTQEAVQDMKNYLDNGWTMLTLVKYDPKWGHYYWVIDVDQNNNVWAYDPADGTKPVPLNESNVSPSPKYYLAIGVKKI